MSIQALHVEDGNRSDTVRIADTSWNHAGDLRVTVREMIGGYGSWVGGRKRAISAMRALASRAVAGGVRVSLVREHFDGIQAYATFDVVAAPA